MTLSNVELAALRHADSVVFSYRDGGHLIRATKDADSSSGFERSREIPVRGRITAYGPPAEEFSWAVSWIGSARYSPEWQTIARLLRAGDRLELEWVADNNTQGLESLGLHQDELKLHVVRETRNGRARRTVFTLDTRVSQDNTSRMMRRAEHAWAGP